jgi:hypothetical protein
MTVHRAGAVTCGFFLAGFFVLIAQTITGTLVGSLSDPSGLAIAGGRITLVQVETGAVRDTVASERGDFVLSSLPPGEYTLVAKAEGFKLAEWKRIMLTASETRSLGAITMEIGSLTESVTVTTEGAAVQTASSERAEVITSSQISGLQVKGRNVYTLLELMPGVAVAPEPETPGRGVSTNVNGSRANTVNLTLDGLGINQAAAANGLLTVSQEAVSELKLLTVGYPAEYGRFVGANLQIVTKSGTRDFHGWGSYFKRHEEFNANNFFNNRLGLDKPQYRYNVWNYGIGGPIFIPGKWNTKRDKLFFLWSQEFWPVKTAGGIRQVTVPTELERAGNFSQSVDLNGRLIPVKDPTNGLQFPGNVIPASRLDSSGRGLLNSFPTPNFLNRTLSAGRYNFVDQASQSSPVHLETLKLDYNHSPKHRFSSALHMALERNEGYQTPVSGGSTNWNMLYNTFSNMPVQLVIRYTGVYSPTVVNELTIGGYRDPQVESFPEDAVKNNLRQTWGFTVGQIAPSNNAYGILPNVSFGGVTQAANRAFDGRFPFLQLNLGYAFSDSLTKTWGPHTLKAGILVDRFITSGGGDANNNFPGNFDFATDANNPLDTGYAYANAVLGVFRNYTEATGRPGDRVWFSGTDWFVQDSWKVNRRLTLDYGLRFCWIGYPVYPRRRVAGFRIDQYDRQKAVRLIRPGLSGGKQVGLDPVTGQTYPAALVGAIVPNSGNPSNGMVSPLLDPSYPVSLLKNPGPRPAPRFGFAYDPWGKGKSSLRGGFGVFYNRSQQAAGPSVQTPIISNPILYYATFRDVLSSAGIVFPQAVSGSDPNIRTPRIMNFHVSFERNVGFGTIVDVAYVGSLGRHLLWSRLLDPIPLGANFNPANANPTNTRVALSPVFLRGYQGYSGVTYSEWAGTSNYHSLQVTANRRFARGVEFGAAWTWSKAMNFNDADGNAVTSLVPVRIWNYGLAGYDRTHVLRANWLWSVPSVPWRARTLDRVLNHWQVSGIASFVSGAPAAVGYSFVTSTDITGTSDLGARIVAADSPVLGRGERTFSRNFRTDVFRAPTVGTIGNSARTILRGPGVNNWDLSVFKNFLVREPLRIQYRFEMYNAFNHTQFAGWDTTARFDAAGNQVNARLGEATSARSPRQIQMGLKILF